jgi:hypothetical protein
MEVRRYRRGPNEKMTPENRMKTAPLAGEGLMASTADLRLGMVDESKQRNLLGRIELNCTKGVESAQGREMQVRGEMRTNKQAPMIQRNKRRKNAV